MGVGRKLELAHPRVAQRARDAARVEHRGAVPPPISVMRVDGGFAVRDGHHRVSAAPARGALTIDAIVDAL